MIYGRKQSEKTRNKKTIYEGVVAAVWMRTCLHEISIYFLT